MYNNLQNLDKTFLITALDTEFKYSFNCCGYTAETETARDKLNDGGTASELLSVRYKRIQ